MNRGFKKIFCVLAGTGSLLNISCNGSSMYKKIITIPGNEFVKMYEEERNVLNYAAYQGIKEDYHYMDYYNVGKDSKATYSGTFRTHVKSLPQNFPMYPQKPIATLKDLEEIRKIRDTNARVVSDDIFLEYYEQVDTSKTQSIYVGVRDGFHRIDHYSRNSLGQIVYQYTVKTAKQNLSSDFPDHPQPYLKSPVKNDETNGPNSKIP